MKLQCWIIILAVDNAIDLLESLGKRGEFHFYFSIRQNLLVVTFYVLARAFVIP